MPGPSKQTLGMIGAALLVVVCVFAILAAFRYLSSWNIPGRGLVFVHEYSARARRSVGAAVAAWNGTEPSIQLVAEVDRLRTSLASLQDVAEENEFLRRIADLPARQEHRAVIGGVFAYAATGGEIEAVINRGERDGIVSGSTAVTQSGAFLGTIERVNEHSSTIRVLGDPSVQVTGRLAGTATGGLVRVDQSGQVILDLIGKDEAVPEGATVMTSGLDHAPAGLIIGTVRSVDPESVTLFQTIHLDVAHTAEQIWRVIILIP